MKKQIFSAVVALAAVAAMSVSAFAVDAGSTNGSAEGKVEDGKVTLDNSVVLEGGLADGVEVTVEVEPVAEAEAKNVAKAIEKGAPNVEVKAVNTVITITADDGETQPDGSVKVTVAWDGASNQVIYVGDDGKVEVLPTERNGDLITFTTTHFSDFYMVTATVNTNGGTNQPDNNKDNPSTGVVLAVIPAVAAAAAIVVSKKRK